MLLDWALLAALEPGDLQARLLAEAGAVMDGHDGEEEDRLLASLPEPLRATWLVDWMDFEISQGSILAYFYNSHGRHARLAASVLSQIGAATMASILSEAIDVYERSPAEWEARRASNDALGEGTVLRPYKNLPGTSALSQLTDQFWDAASTDDWGAKLDHYLAGQVRNLAGISSPGPQ
jgi:hypothetical protein